MCRGIHQPTRRRSGSLDLASRYRFLRSIPRVTDPKGVQQHVIGVDHCIKRRSARCPTARSPSSIIACRTEAGNSSHRAINSRVSDQFAPPWISNAPDSAPLSKSRPFSPCFTWVFESLRGNFLAKWYDGPRKTLSFSGLFLLTDYSAFCFLTRFPSGLTGPRLNLVAPSF
jgi:hypothetical protein